jgi:beta-glucosidase
VSGLQEREATAPADRESLKLLAERFPPGFAWGVATSAYQVEGAVAVDGRGPSIWDTFSHQPGRVRNGDTGDVACDHYHRWADDVALMASLGIRAYRFSVSWSRVMPEGVDVVNRRGLDFYDRLVDVLLAHGIRPLLTLYHWDLPQALEDRGGWRNPDMPAWFAEYAGVVADRLADRVRDWITINEPQVFAFTGHAEGRHAPGTRDWRQGLLAADGALRGHAAAAERLRAGRPGIRVGAVIDANLVEAAGPEDEHEAAARTHVAIRQRWFLEPLFGRGYPAEALAAHAAAGHLTGVPVDVPLPYAELDFLGVNYYTREVVAAEAGTPFGLRVVRRDGVERTTMNWEIHADGLAAVLQRIHDSYSPPAVFVTENGAAFLDEPDDDGRVNDVARRAYLAGHIAAAAGALESGVPLQGYFVWSLLDNFEWDKGFEQRFGIVRVDFATQRRTVKASGEWYRSLIAAAP